MTVAQHRPINRHPAALASWLSIQTNWYAHKICGNQWWQFFQQ